MNAYKVSYNGVGTFFKSKEIRMSNLVQIDNVLGVGILNEGDADVQLSVLKDSDIYGAGGSEDCPDKHPCYCSDKRGITTFSSQHKGKDFHIGESSPLPMHHIMAYGSWASEADFYRVNFKNWEEPDFECGATQRIIRVNKDQSDFIPTQRFTYCTFTNVNQKAIAYLMDPPEGWNNLADCVGFPCTAPANLILDFK